jgi:hypothetical protein
MGHRSDAVVRRLDIPATIALLKVRELETLA